MLEIRLLHKTKHHLKRLPMHHWWKHPHRSRIQTAWKTQTLYRRHLANIWQRTRLKTTQSCQLRMHKFVNNPKDMWCNPICHSSCGNSYLEISDAFRYLLGVESTHAWTSSTKYCKIVIIQ